MPGISVARLRTWADRGLDRLRWPLALAGLIYLIYIGGPVIVPPALNYIGLYSYDYRPLESHPILVLNPKQLLPDGETIAVVGPHDKIQASDGLCNKTDHPVAAELYVRLEQHGLDPAGKAVVGAVFDVVGSQDAPQTYTLFPRECVGTQPTSLDVPPGVTPGIYVLTLDSVARSESGQEQRQTTPSAPFRIER